MKIFANLTKSIRQIAQWKQLLKQIKPTTDFDIEYALQSPDYSKLSSWAAHPNITSKAYFTPASIPMNDSWKAGQVDCFFVHPTLYFSPNNWNASIDSVATNELVDELIIPGQASVFNTCCRIFAPRYRQATFYSFLKTSKNSRQALTLAGDDILAAFEIYLKEWNQGRPFFLAGHSQGALHIIRLLEERIHNTSLAKQLVAAYPIGYQFPLDKLYRTLPNISASTSKQDIHCIVTWDTFLETGKPLSFLDRAEMCYYENEKLTWERRAFKKLLGHNPLTWQQEKDWVDSEQHKGGVHVLLERSQKMTLHQIVSQQPMDLSCTQLSSFYPNLVKAKIGRKGLLFVSPPTHRLFRNFVIPGGSLHVFDIALFYMDLRNNIEERWVAYQQLYKKQ